MPKIPRYKRQVTKPAIVGQAPLPLDIADTGAQAIGQGLQQLGAGVTNIGITLKRATQKRQDIADMTERINVTSLMNASGRNIQTKIETEPDYTKWDGFREEELKALQNNISANNLMSDKEKSLSMARLEAWNIEKSSQLRLQQAQTIVDTGQKTILAGLEMAYSTGSKSDQATVEDAWNLMWPELFPNKTLAKEAHGDAVARGKKQFKNATIDHWENLAAANPELTISVIEEEIAERKEGRGVYNKDVLSNDDLVDIINHARTVQRTLETTAEQQKKELQELTAISISGRVTDAQTYDQRVSLIQDIGNAVQNETLDRKVGEGYIRELRDGPDAVTDWPLVADLKLEIEAVRDGQKDFLEVYNQIQSFRGSRLGKNEAETLTGQILSAKNIAENKLPAVQANTLRRYQNILKAYYNAGLFGDTEDKKELSEASEKYAEIGEQLDRFLIDNPDAKQKEVQEFFDGLVGEVKNEGIRARISKWSMQVAERALGVELLKRLGWWEPLQKHMSGFGIIKETLRRFSEQSKTPLPERKIGTIRVGRDNESYILVELNDDPNKDLWEPL